MTKHDIKFSEPVGEKVSTTCYMCACRCGINVYLKDGANGEKSVRYIEGNRDHPVNKGVLCAKGFTGAIKRSHETGGAARLWRIC